VSKLALNGDGEEPRVTRARGGPAARRLTAAQTGVRR
jgi:hypothetical protein